MSVQFPDYLLNQYQAANNAAATSRLSAASLEPLTLQMMMEYATEEELAQWHGLSLQYADERGSVELRSLISSQYPGLEADNILLFSGATEALFCAFNATVTAGNTVVAITPAYEPLLAIPKALGAQVKAITLHKSGGPLTTDSGREAHGSWQFPVDELQNHLQGGVDQLVINFPHNPSGAHINKATQSSIVEIALSANAWLFSDEVFRGLEHDVKHQLPPIASLYARGISLGSVAKPHGLGGVRIGWLACQNKEVLQRALTIKRSLSICPAITDEWLATVALRNSKKLIAASQLLLSKHIDLIENSVSALGGRLNWLSPQAGCVAFPEIGDSIDVGQLAEKLLTDRGIMMIPGNCFPSLYQNHFRLGYGLKNFPDVWANFVDYLLRY